jgi:hypothetical protein
MTATVATKLTDTVSSAGKIVLCYRLTTVGGAAIQPQSLGLILRYATAIKIHPGQITLRDAHVAS